jgi:hypothetical protein
MATRRVYEADRAVIEECIRRGVVDITARKLERWRRYLPERVVEHQPGVRGSRSLNPSGYVDQVIAINSLIKSGVRLRDVSLRLFEQGFPIAVEVLREAYTDLYGWLRHGLTTRPPGSDVTDVEPGDRADALAAVHAPGIRGSAAGRRWAKRVRRLVSRGGAAQGDNPDMLFAGIISAMFTWLVAGEQPSAQGMTDALTAAGLQDGQAPEAAAAHLATINLDAILDAIEHATETQWLVARQDIDLLARHVELLPRVERRWRPDDPLRNGLADVGLENPELRSILTPIALVLGQTWHNQLHAAHQLYRAVSRLLDDLPDQYRPFLAPDGEGWLEEQPEAFRAELGLFLVTWSRENPSDAVSLNFVVPPVPVR